MEFHRLPGVLRPVLDLGVHRGLQGGKPGPGADSEVAQAERAALLHRPHRRLVTEPGEQVAAGVLAQERHVQLALHLVAGDREGHVEPGGVVPPLPVHPHPLAGRLGDQDGQVEPGEHARGERLRARGAVHHHVLPGAVDEMVQVQLDRAGLRVIAGHPEVGVAEPAGGHQPRPARRTDRQTMHRVVAAQPQQPRSPARRGGLHHRRGRGDPRVIPAQIFLDLRQMLPHRRRDGSGTERLGEMLVDVRVDRHHRQALAGQVPHEQRRQRRLAAATLAHERDLHRSPLMTSLA